MRVPSYDDLTPSIPDISFRDGLAQVDRLLPGSSKSAAALGTWDLGLGTCAAKPAFACLRSARAPQAIAAIARDFSPRLQRHGGACVILDVSGLGRLIGDAHAIGAELQREALARGGDIRIAVGATQVSVSLLALANRGLTIAAGTPAESVATLPLSALRAWLDDRDASSARGKISGADQQRLETFARWGLKTLGDVAALPAADLSARMGQQGLALQRLARGEDATPLVPDPGVPRYVQSIDLEWPIDALEPLSFVLARLLEPLSAALEHADRAAAAIRLQLRLVDRTTHERVLLLPAAMRDPRVLRTLLLLDLESHPPSAAIDVVAVEADPAPSRIVQYSLLDRALPSPETIATLTARLGALVGESRCGSPSLLDTHRADGWEMKRFNPETPSILGAGGREPAFGIPPFRDPERWIPPSRAGERREAGAVALRRFRPPIAIRVTVEHGRPVHIFIDRRGMPGGRVEQLAGPWRSSGEWWDGKAWNRDEWDLTFGDGATCRVFQDRTAGQWFLDGIVD